MNTTRQCKCGKRKRLSRPACDACWRDYLAGSSPSQYVPREDGLLTPYECTPEWERQQVKVAGLLGRPSPFGLHDVKKPRS